MDAISQTTFEPSATVEKLALHRSTSTVDTEFSLFDDSSVDEEGHQLNNVSPVDDHHETSDELDLRCRLAEIRKHTTENCDEVKTRISSNRSKTRSSRRKPKGRRGACNSTL